MDAAADAPRPPPLVPGPEGSPLPPRDPRIALRWPAETRRIVDALLGLFADDVPPTVPEIEAKLRLRLVERELNRDERTTYVKRYFVPEGPYARPMWNMDRVGNVGYNIFRADRRPGDGGELHRTQLVLSPQQTGYCLDPYELAVYTGARFINGDRSGLHTPYRKWPPAYAWGMFGWGRESVYLARGFEIDVVRPPGADRPIASQERCVAGFTVERSYRVVPAADAPPARRGGRE